MSKTMKRLVSLCMAFAMTMTCFITSANAAALKEIKDVDLSTIIEYQYVLPSGGEVVGTIEDAIIDDSSPTYSLNALKSGSLFSMTAKSVGDNYLLVTGPSKSFYSRQLTLGGLRIIGNLHEDTGKHISVKVGACRYDSDSGLFIAYPDTYEYVTTGGSVRIEIPKSNFSKEYSYRGFIKHFDIDAHVSGNLSFYNANV